MIYGIWQHPIHLGKIYVINSLQLLNNSVVHEITKGNYKYFRSVCGRSNVGYATGLRSIRRVSNALLSNSPNIIMWPSGEYKNQVIEGFQQKGFPNTIGCIDGMFVKILKPKYHGASYNNIKGFSSIILQVYNIMAICSDL